MTPPSRGAETSYDVKYVVGSGREKSLSPSLLAPMPAAEETSADARRRPLGHKAARAVPSPNLPPKPPKASAPALSSESAGQLLRHRSRDSKRAAPVAAPDSGAHGAPTSFGINEGEPIEVLFQGEWFEATVLKEVHAGLKVVFTVDNTSSVISKKNADNGGIRSLPSARRDAILASRAVAEPSPPPPQSAAPKTFVPPPSSLWGVGDAVEVKTADESWFSATVVAAGVKGWSVAMANGSSTVAHAANLRCPQG